MNILSLKEVRGLPQKVVALGYFDGGHTGHRALLRETIKRAAAYECDSAVFSFPSLPTKGGELLSSLDGRLAFFEEMGIGTVILAAFDEVRTMSAEAFVSDILKERCAARLAVCGFNYRFGHGASGDGDTLCRLLPESVVLPPTLFDGAPVSASRIRTALSNGDMEAASKMLGRPYTVKGKVTHGKAMGATLGFPTANIRPETLLPRLGVYKTEVKVDGVSYAGLSDVGVRPTVEGGGEVRVETFLPHFSGDLYGATLSVSFLSFLREEKRFASTDELAAQIRRDLEAL